MKYIVLVDAKNDWTEEVDTVEEGIEMLRMLIETEKKYTFAGTTEFHYQSHGPNASKAMQVKWIYIGEDGKVHMMCKSIRIKGLVRKDEHPPKKFHHPIEDWDAICAPLRAMLK